jgi:hypothetical protein
MENFSTCIILGWGSGGGCGDYDDDPVFSEGLVAWVENGGCLIVQGEGISDSGVSWPSWFGLDWKSSWYRRTTHVLNTNHWFSEEAHSLVPRMNVKACMVTNVELEDRLYGAEDDAVTHSLVPGFRGIPVSSDQVAVALAKYGAGTVSFYGDVNIEEETIKTVGMIARYAASASRR